MFWIRSPKGETQNNPKRCRAALATALQKMPLIKIADRQLEYEWHGPSPELAPTLVFLHEGLGCVAMWRDFPAHVAEQTGCGALVYSRAGYGKSEPIELPRQVTFMHQEALATLPQVLDAFSIRAAILVGHSDGGSISIIHAGGTSDSRVPGCGCSDGHWCSDASDGSFRLETTPGSLSWRECRRDFLGLE